MTHYEVLGIAPTASTAAVRQAYVRLAREHHPDFHMVDGGVSRRRSERTMQRINEAWAVLGDDGRRRAYDRTLAQAAHAARTAAASARAHSQSTPDADPDPDDVDLDLLDDEALTDAQVRGSWTILPVALFFSSVVLFCIAMVLQAAPLLALSVMVFVLSGLAFVVLPFVAMATSRRDDLAGGGRP